jgi:Fe-S cluster biogenesis protein NfuA
MTSQEFRNELLRIEELVRAIESTADPNVRASAVELMTALMNLHGAAVERMMEITFETGESGAETIDRFGDDELVSSVLLLYGLHPLGFEARVLRALEKVRPMLKHQGGEVELLGTADGVVRLRLEGSFDGRGSSAMKLKLAIEEALYDSAPDLAAIEVEGVVAEPSAPVLVQIGRARATDAAP